MDNVGMALVVGVFGSGLIFLIPVRDRRSPFRNRFEEAQERLE
jgi:hypothetical protein